MATSRWHKFYSSEVAASPALLFALLSDMPKYTRWLPPSATFAGTSDVQPYPVRLGSRYRDGRPGERSPSISRTAARSSSSGVTPTAHRPSRCS